MQPLQRCSSETNAQFQTEIRSTIRLKRQFTTCFATFTFSQRMVKMHVVSKGIYIYL